MSPVHGAPLPMREAWTEFRMPGFSLAHLGSEPVDKRSLFLWIYPSFPLSNKLRINFFKGVLDLAFIRLIKTKTQWCSHDSWTRTSTVNKDAGKVVVGKKHELEPSKLSATPYSHPVQT